MRYQAVLLALLSVTPVSGYVARGDIGAREPRAGTLQLDLNLPSFQLDVYEGGVRTRRYRIAVGMRGYRTPRGVFAITSVEWNPWWIPPDNEWARDEERTPPGSANPMGRVKLNFRPLYFIHGTPSEASLGSAASHGCVRMANADAIALARLVHATGTPFLSRTLLDSLVADTSFTRLLHLDVPVSIVIRYDPAEVDQDTLFMHRDIYNLDRRGEMDRARDALGVYGIDPEYVDAKKLSSRLRSTTRRPLKIAVDELLIGASKRDTALR